MLISDFDSYTFFPGQHWCHTWERQHELISRFSKLLCNQEIKIFSPLGLLNHNPLNATFWKRILLYEKAQNSIEINPIERNMKMLNCIHIPFHSHLVGKFNSNLIRELYNIRPKNFFWATYMNPTLYNIFKKSTFRVYDIAERRSRNPLLPLSVKDLERKAVQESDIVFVDNYATYNDYRDLNRNMYYVPQGVNTETFFKTKDEKKYIGYIGNLHSAVDYDFLEELIQRNPQEDFLFIGSILEKRAYSLLKYQNVTHLGQMAKKDLNQYLAKMKCGLIPYLINDVTIGVYPTKLFEYLAANVPVISTRLPEVIQYENPAYLQIISSPQSLVNLEFTMNGASRLIEENTWNVRWNVYINSIEKCLK
jgi:glycosyltransferase involved in cell wall biosynthesis